MAENKIANQCTASPIHSKIAELLGESQPEQIIQLSNGVIVSEQGNLNIEVFTRKAMSLRGI